MSLTALPSGLSDSVPTFSMDASTEAPVAAAIPAIVADALANGDQRIPLETRRQFEAINNPLQLEGATRDDKIDHIKEQEQKSSRQTYGGNTEMEKMRIDFELTVLKRQHDENDRQRQHEEKMERIHQQVPSRTTTRAEDEQLGAKLDPITEIELEKMRMEFELAKLKHISEENERQRQHEQKMCEDKEKQRLHEEKMEQMHQLRGPFLAGSQKASGDPMTTSSVVFAEAGKVRIELQLAMQIYLPEMNDKKLPGEPSGQQETPKREPPMETSPEAGKLQPLPAQKENDGVTEHLGMQVPRIVVSGAEPEWSSSRLDLAIETELEKRRMEFELTRLKFEHDENEQQRQHEEKMERLRQQAALKESE